MSIAARLAKSNAKDVNSFLGGESTHLSKEADPVVTPLPILNMALSGKINGGLLPGVTIFAGDSSTGKTLLSWLAARAFQHKYPDSVVVFYDSEFGTTKEYLEGLGIDLDRVIHIPVENIEELNFDIMAKLEDIKQGDKVFFLMDSLGNIASKKEVEDALAEKSVQDLSRAKKMKGLFRQITAPIANKELYFVGIAHTYEGQGMFAKTEVSGGRGLFYAANTLIITSKSKAKDGAEQSGVNINMTMRKSRFIREGIRFSAELDFTQGFKPFSGMLDLLLDTGVIHKPSNGYYQAIDLETGEIPPTAKKMRQKELETKEVLIPILKSEIFQKKVQQKLLLVKEGTSTIDNSLIDELS